MAHVSHKLKNAFEGALAGGGDPATSPLYVFGPFLKLIVVAGVAQVTFGASVWLVVMTIAVVSAMYRLVMRWVTDGSGGSGLSEEEFGGWAVKLNAAITFIEYTLTFLVSMAALVTFIADRFALLNRDFLGLPFIQYRTIVAIVLSIFTGWLVNRGPKMAARTFGPATAGVLALLWIMVISSIVKYGFHLPDFNFQAFNSEHIHFTLGGYVRILAVMTGIEVFANLVAAYDGSPTQKSSKAFGSLLIIMGTTGITMLIVGPVIFQVADPTNTHVSVFTQTMDILLPEPLPYIGTLIGIAVLMSASAASAQGLQNLALGLKERRYIPPRLGSRNLYDVADMPVWIEVAIVSLCFLFIGTHEETYLAIYAAGVFILLSMTGWAVMKRLLRGLRESFAWSNMLLIVGTVVAASLTTVATAVIFYERFFEGAWTYFLFIPILYGVFSYYRNQYGEPTPEMDFLGRLDSSSLAGFGFGQVARVPIMPGKPISTNDYEVVWHPDSNALTTWKNTKAQLGNIMVLLDGSSQAAKAIPVAGMIAQKLNSHVTVASFIKQRSQEQYKEDEELRKTYLDGVVSHLKEDGVEAHSVVQPGSITDKQDESAANTEYDIVVVTTQGESGVKNWFQGGFSHKLVQKIEKPVLLVDLDEDGNNPIKEIGSILVALDGSSHSERALPYARALAKALNSRLVLLSVPAVPDASEYRAPAEIIENIRSKAEAGMRKYLESTAAVLRKDGLTVSTKVAGSIPSHAIVETAKEEKIDLIMLTSQGRGSAFNPMLMGRVADYVVDNTHMPVFMVPIKSDGNGSEPQPDGSK